MNMEVFQLVVSISVEMHWDICEMDVTAAFLQANGFNRDVFLYDLLARKELKEFFGSSRQQPTAGPEPASFVSSSFVKLTTTYMPPA